MAAPQQTRAMFFILLLVGHEAVRVKNTLHHKRSETWENSAEREDPAGEWRAENAACTWSSRHWACIGHDADTTPCGFRYLPNDGLPPFSSESCRLQDDHMLSTNRAKYFKLQAKLIAVKSKNFASKCMSAGMLNFKCTRRAKHVFRAIKFMSKAQGASLLTDLNDEEKQASKALFQESLSHMTSFAGPDAKFVLMLREKMIARSGAVKQKPMESIQQVVRLLTMLLRGSAQDKEDARKAITSMPAKAANGQNGDASELRESLENHLVEIRKGIDSEAEELDDEPRESTAVMQTLPRPPNGTALLQESGVALQEVNVTLAGSDIVVVKSIAFVVIVVLVVIAIIWAVIEIIAAIVAWAMLSIIGCGAYAAGNNAVVSRNKLPDDENFGVVGTMKCIAKVFTLPFVAVYKGGKAISRVFQKNEPSSLSHEERTDKEQTVHVQPVHY